MTKLSLFLYGRLSPRVHRTANWIGMGVALSWLYFALVYKQFISRFITGKLQLIDLLVGLPLVIALAPVLYALVYWSVKWLVIIFWPHLISAPIDHDD